MGYTNVKALKGGVKAWKASGYKLTSQAIPKEPHKLIFA
jgi:3-mercaptopyruvate sulfurtransferase SseA